MNEGKENSDRKWLQTVLATTSWMYEVPVLQPPPPKYLLCPAVTDFLAFEINRPKFVTDTQYPGVDLTEVKHAHVRIAFNLYYHQGEGAFSVGVVWDKIVRKEASCRLQEN